ncbi:unnamed protein product, partial [marine sediment metagenome]
TLVVEFNIAENPNDVNQIDVLWEGYGDKTHHMELYIWDYVQGNWGDGAGLYGENNYMDANSGDADFTLTGSITTNVSNYISPSGEVTLLIYDDHKDEDTFHDYMRIVVTIRGALPQYTVTATADPNGYIDPNGAIVKGAGEDQLFTAYPNTGYTVNTWYLDGNSVQVGGTTYTLTNIQADHTVYATFEQLQYTLTINTVGSGSVTRVPDQATYTYGQTVDLTAAASAGWTFSAWSGDLGGSTNPETITMDGNKSVTATFTEGQYTITATSDANGTISPSGAVVVDYGADQLFTATANLGYEVNTWYLDGNDLGISDVNYTLTNITSDHTVNVTFKLEQLEYTISGTITCAGSAVADVNMVGLGVVADANGFYSATVSSGWSGVVTPAKYGYTFDPNSRSYINVTTDRVNQDYDALPWDHFDDARRSSMWRSVADGDPALAWLDEDTNNLNMRAFGLPPSCVGHWKMNDNAANTTVEDSSGNGNHGTFNDASGDPNTQAHHVDSGNPPNLNGALTFNGTSDYVDIGDVVGTVAYTKVAWVKRAAGDSYNNIVSSGDVWSHAIYAPYTQSFRLSAGHENPFTVVQDSEPLEVDVWYQVAVTFDPNVSLGRMVLYKDGVQVDDANNVPTHSASTSTYIGRFVSGYGMNGAIDNVMIFDRALTTEEIA